MKFGVSQEVNWKAEESSYALQNFVDELAVKISSQDYGTAIEHFIIGFICIRTEPGYEEWYKERKPRFRKLKKVKLSLGQISELHNIYSYDIKLSDAEVDIFVSAKDKGLKLFCNRLISSLSHFDSPSMKKRDFNSKAFQVDMKRFIRELSNA